MNRIVESKRAIWDDEPVSYRIIYGDTDKAGVVYYANYLRFFEIGRTEWMRNMLQIPYSELEGTGVLFPVVEAGIKYKAPAFYDDMIYIHSGLLEYSRVSLTFCYEIRREGELLVVGHTKHAATNEKGRLMRMPERLLEALASIC